MKCLRSILCRENAQKRVNINDAIGNQLLGGKISFKLMNPK